MIRPWICFFSQTGSEICNLAEKLDRSPSAIITNRTPEYVKERGNPKLQQYEQFIRYIPAKPTLEDYNRVLEPYLLPLITLHGYLRIVPAKICDRYEIYNLHPGLITKFPELKGKDPQRRAFESWHKEAGCVIHKCTAELDSGAIVTEKSISIAGHKTVASVIEDLHKLALVTWLDFFKNYESTNSSGLHLLR